MIYDLTPAPAVDWNRLKAEYTKTQRQADFEKHEYDHILSGTDKRIKELEAISETDAVIVRARYAS